MLTEIDKIVDVDKSLAKVREIVSGGGVIIFPTDTVYGLGSDAYNQSAVKRIYEIKKRAANSPLALLLGEVSEVENYCGELSTLQRKWLNTLLPGPFTVLMPAGSPAPQVSVSEEGKIGLRVPDCSSFRKIYRASGHPLVGTSVNISGHPPLKDINDIKSQFGRQVDLIIKTDQPMTGKASSIIDLTKSEPKVIRGTLPEELR